jgi:hypothetical protein
MTAAGSVPLAGVSPMAPRMPLRVNVIAGGLALALLLEEPREAVRRSSGPSPAGRAAVNCLRMSHVIRGS